MLGDLVPDVEIAEVYEVMEEEKSSSMPGKYYNEGDDAGDEDRTKQSLEEHTEQ